MVAHVSVYLYVSNFIEFFFALLIHIEILSVRLIYNFARSILQ